jgi:DNA-binding NarL/FixJ family response regulator
MRRKLVLDDADLGSMARHDEGELTPREIEVLNLVATGRTNRQIARMLFISAGTVGIHVSHILDKLDVPNRAAAATVAYQRGLFASPGSPTLCVSCGRPAS